MDTCATAAQLTAAYRRVGAAGGAHRRHSTRTRGDRLPGALWILTLGMPEGTAVLREVLSRRVVSAFSQRLFVMVPFVLHDRSGT